MKSLATTNLPTRVLLAMVLCIVALTLPLFIAAYAQEAWELDKLQHNMLKAFLVTAFVVLGVWYMRVKLDRGQPRSIGLGNVQQAILRFLLGFGLILIPLLLTLFITTLMGWALVNFNWHSAPVNAILLGMLSVLLTDALPEELIFRGYLFSNLCDKYTKWKSALITTFLFVLFPVILIPLQKLLGPEYSTGIVSSLSVGYLTYLLFFGIFAIYLRVLTKSIWTGVGFHLMFVFMNQIMGLEPTHLIQFSEITSETPLQITMVVLLSLTFIILLAYPRIKNVKLGWLS